MNTQEIYPLFLQICYWVLLPLTFISYLLEAFSGDLYIYFGTAKVAALTPGFPMTLDSVWESRFIGHRLLYYLLNAIDPFHGWEYMIWVKLIVGLILLAVIYYFAKQVSERLAVSFDYVFLLTFFGLFAVHSLIIFSAEWFSVVIALLMLAMILDTRREIQTLSGLLILPLLILKGLPVLLVLVVVLATVMLVPDYLDRFKRAVWSLPVVGLAVAAFAWYFPHFISDILFASKMARVGHLEISQIIINFFWYSISIVGTAPVIIIGIASMLLLLSVVVKDQLRDLKLLIAMWLVASAYVIYLQEFWYYHYYLMLIPAILTTLYFLKVYPEHRKAFGLMIVAVLIIFAGLVAGWSLGMGFSAYTETNQRQAVIDNIISHTDILSQPATLYLDAGTLSYYFTTPSACRYVGAIPYQRDMPEWNMNNSPEFWEDRNCSLNYTGKYIIVNPVWFNLTASTHTEMNDKLKREYAMIYHNIFKIDSPATNYSWDIYQREI